MYYFTKGMAQECSVIFIYFSSSTGSSRVLIMHMCVRLFSPNLLNNNIVVIGHVIYVGKCLVKGGRGGGGFKVNAKGQGINSRN